MDLVQMFRAELLRGGYRLGERLAVGYSGGVDSTALLLLAIETLTREAVVALHIDHGTRPRSPLDAQHCRHIAESLGVEFIERRILAAAPPDVRRAQGKEGSLRVLRYSLLEEICREHHLRYLATGHQADDAVETHLLALARGSGLTGLAGPRPWRDLSGSVRLLRPLLDFSRKQLQDYLATRWPEIATVQDETNVDESFARNRLRHRLLPQLVAVAGGAEPLRRSIHQLQEDREALEWMLQARQDALGIDPESTDLDLAGSHDLTDPAVVFAIRRYLARHTGGYAPSQQIIRRIRTALEQPGRTRWIDVAGARFRISNRTICLEEVELPSCLPIRLPLDTTIRSAQLSVTLVAEILRIGPDSPPWRSPERVQFDAQVLGPDVLENLVLRAAQPGDRFRPFGLAGTTRLFRWLAGQGVSRVTRSRVPVVAHREEILWVVSMRRSDCAPITERTLERLCLTAGPWVPEPQPPPPQRPTEAAT